MPYPAESLVRDGHLRSMHSASALAVHMAIYALGPDVLTEDICQKTGLSARTLTKCLDILEQRGLLDIERTSGRNRYRLRGLPEACGDGEPVPDSDPPNQASPARTSRRGVFQSRDGHSCASELEARVDDQLHHFGIWHAREVPYATLIPSWEGKHTVDFVLAAGLAIEVAGHTSTEYRATLNEKVERAKAGGWRVLVVQSGDLYDIIDEQLARAAAARLNRHDLRMLQGLFRLAPDDLCSKLLLRPRIHTLVEANARSLREAVVLTVLRGNATTVDAYRLSLARGVSVPEYELMLRSALVDGATAAGDETFAMNIRGTRMGLPEEFWTAFRTLEMPTGEALQAAEADLASRRPPVREHRDEGETPASETDVDAPAPAAEVPDVSGGDDPPVQQSDGLFGAMRRLLGLPRG